MIEWGFKITKPVGYIVYGHSLEEFDNRIEEFKDLDIYWVSLNNWQIAESILAKIGKELDLVFVFEGNGQPCPYAKTLGPSEERGNTLFESLMQMMENGVKDVYLFGADGFNDRHEFGYKTAHGSPQTMYGADLAYFNEHYQAMLENKGMAIFNTSQTSQYVIPKITIDECIKKIKV